MRCAIGMGGLVGIASRTRISGEMSYRKFALSNFTRRVDCSTKLERRGFGERVRNLIPTESLRLLESS